MSSSLEKIQSLTDALQFGTVRDADDTINLRYAVSGPLDADKFIFFLNGRTEYIEKYVYLAEDLQLPKRVAFVGLDHRGQGGSGGARSFVDTYDSYANDLQQIIRKVATGKPYAIVTHSMGGLIGLYAAMTKKIHPECIVLSSPLLGLPNDPVPRPLAKPLSQILTRVGLGNVSSGGGNFARINFERNKLTHDIDLYRRMQDSPYKLPGATFGWVTATFAAIDVVFDEEQVRKFDTPTIILAGGAEKVVDPDAIGRWVRLNLEKPDNQVSYHVIPGAKHELFSEIPAYYQPAVRYVKSFLDKNFLNPKT